MAFGYPVDNAKLFKRKKIIQNLIEMALQHCDYMEPVGERVGVGTLKASLRSPLT